MYDLIRLADGRTFYTMKPLRGRTLAEAVSEFHQRRPARPADARAFRTLLRAFIDLCRTIGFAHRHGVVHRDIKGANVQVDEFGAVVVLDWGIAKLTGEADDGAPPLDAGAGDTDTATQVGQARGTPLYMAPEQAAGDAARVGMVSDVYSLGAVLFEVLCGAHAVERGATVAETIDNVIAGKVGRPRAAAPWVPSALEAVCLKALARDPAARYATADALADDVQRHLDDEAVTVRRAPVAERFARWTRRNRLLVRSVFVGGALALVALAAVAVVQLLNGIRIEGEAKKATQSADIARQRAADARKAEGEARLQADRAKEALRISLRAIVDSLVKLNEDRFRTQPGLQPINKELLERAATGCDALLELAPDDPAVLAEVGKVRVALATVAADLDHESTAIRHLEQALAFQQRRAAAAPDDVTLELELAALHYGLGMRLARTADGTRAGAELKAARAAFEKLLADPRVRSDPKRLARCECELGRALTQLARWHLGSDKNVDAAWSAACDGVKHLEAAVARDPDHVQHRFLMGVGLIEAGLVARACKRYPVARLVLTEARRVLEALPPSLLREAHVQQHLGNAYQNSFLVEDDERKTAVARPFVERAVEVRERLTRENPAVVPYKAETASSLSSLALYDLLDGHVERSAQAFTRCLVLYDEVVRLNPDVPAYRHSRREVAIALGRVLVGVGRATDATNTLLGIRPELTTAGEFVLVGTALVKCAAAIRGTSGALTGQAERDWRRAADAAVACLREAKKRGDPRTGPHLQKLAPLTALRGATGYAELLSDWGITEPRP